MPKKLLFIIILLSFILSASFALALEINYPEIPGAETPQSFISKINSGAAGYSPEMALPLYVKYFYNFSLIIAGLIAFFALILGGFFYMTSAGHPDKMKNAKEQILAGILGLIILLSSYMVLAAVNPQLSIFKLPSIATTTPLITSFTFTPGKLTFTYQEIPIGTLINSERDYGGSFSYSTYEGVLDSDRLNRIIVISDLTKIVSENIKEMSEDLRSLIDSCECQRTYEGDCTPATCGDDFTSCNDTCNKPCTWGPANDQDPCSNRNIINDERKELEILNDAFDYFLDESLKVANFITANSADINAYISPTYPNTYDLINFMDEYENDYGEFKTNLDEYYTIKERLKTAERAVTDCRMRVESYNNFQISKAVLEKNAESDVTTTKLFSDVNVGEDPATFYCLNNTN